MATKCFCRCVAHFISSNMALVQLLYAIMTYRGRLSVRR